MPKVLYLLDGHAIAYRAYYALTSGGATNFTTSSGEPTAGVYGFANRLIRLFEQEERGANLYRSLLSTLGSNQDNAIGTSDTEYGCG